MIHTITDTCPQALEKKWSHLPKMTSWRYRVLSIKPALPDLPVLPSSLIAEMRVAGEQLWQCILPLLIRKQYGVLVIINAVSQATSLRNLEVTGMVGNVTSFQRGQL